MSFKSHQKKDRVVRQNANTFHRWRSTWKSFRQTLTKLVRQQASYRSNSGQGFCGHVFFTELRLRTFGMKWFLWVVVSTQPSPMCGSLQLKTAKKNNANSCRTKKDSFQNRVLLVWFQCGCVAWPIWADPGKPREHTPVHMGCDPFGRTLANMKTRPISAGPKVVGVS